MAEERKVVVAYTVFRYDDGSVDVKDAGVEGATPIETEEAYKDIADVATLIKLKRMENAAFVGAYNGTAKFYKDTAAAQQAAAAAPVEEAK